ncbi:fructose/tagatose bisphosphate aldolase [Paenibacillus brasilensis]|uniref:Fructose/tagatose bisphosphate aldolase n=1 Tax=Paenibacillus brasilensis TaxID=128574 RepID=A0ABU0KTW7_9BACL|nr:fructose/tagatose bisphosphate aldolase [Paenibacillus brasilensis]
MLKSNSDVYDPKTILTPGTAAITAIVKGKMQEFGMSHKADIRYTV